MSKPDPTPPRLVRVVWEDAGCLDTGVWVDTPDEPPAYEPILITSVGFLLVQDDKGVIITAAWSPDRTGPRDQIPKGMVREITFLEPVPARRKTKGLTK